MEGNAIGRQTFDIYLCLLSRGILFAITEPTCVDNFEIVKSSVCFIQLKLAHYTGLNKVCEGTFNGKIEYPYIIPEILICIVFFWHGHWVKQNF